MPAEASDRGSVTGFAAGLMAAMVAGVVLVMMGTAVVADYMELAQTAENLAIAAAQTASIGGDACAAASAVSDSECHTAADSVAVDLTGVATAGPLRVRLRARGAAGFVVESG